jgi:hypothetical protein
MASSSEEVLEAAVARIPEITRIIASLPVEDRPSAFDVAERSYLRTAKYLGGADDLAQRWTSAVILRLRAEVEEQVGANGKLLTALHEELVGLPVEAVTSESALAPSDDASAETIEKDIEQVVLKTYGSDTQRDTLRDGAPAKAETDEQSANQSVEATTNTPLEVEVSEKQRPTEACLVPAEAEPDDNVVEIGETRKQ